jgi:hypothetical protein
MKNFLTVTIASIGLLTHIAEIAAICLFLVFILIATNKAKR